MTKFSKKFKKLLFLASNVMLSLKKKLMSQSHENFRTGVQQKRFCNKPNREYLIQIPLAKYRLDIL